MTPVFQFRVVVDTSPTDRQVSALFRLSDEPSVEVAPEERSGIVWFDRAAPRLAEAIVSAAHDVERVGLRPIRVEPCDEVTLPQAAARLGRSAEHFRALVVGAAGEPGAPTPYPMPVVGEERFYSWEEIATWARAHLDPRLPDDTPVYTAATLVLRLRRVASGVTGMPVLRRLLDESG